MSTAVNRKREQREARSAGPAPVIPIKEAPVREVVESLYEKRKEIYPRQKIGDKLAYFQKWRWALVWITQVVYYGLPWLQWNDRQAVLFDLAARKFYIFGLVLWPQDVFFLAILLMASGGPVFAAQNETVIPYGATWLWRKGTNEVSNPVSAWRTNGFPDAGWLTGPAPFHYGESLTNGTTISDMRNNYRCIFNTIESCTYIKI